MSSSADPQCSTTTRPEQLGDHVDREDPEPGSPDEKLDISTTWTYSGQGSVAEKALVWRQDLRIIPLSAAIYLLW